MSTRESFTVNTNSIVQDSDPKLLRFEQLNNPIGGSTDLGTFLDMSLIKEPGIVAGSNGPILSQLTGGTGSTGNPVTLRHISAGSTPVRITSSDGTQTVAFSLTGADIAAFAIAQGHGDDIAADLDFSERIDPSAIANAGFGSPVSLGVNNLTFGPSDPVFANDLGDSMTLTLTALLDSTIGVPMSLTTSWIADGEGSGNAAVAFTSTASPRLLIHVDISSSGSLSNHIDITLTPPTPYMGDLITGQLSVTFRMPDGSTAGPFLLTSAAVKALANSRGEGFASTFLFTTADLGWDLSPLAGHVVTGIDYQVQGPFQTFNFPLADTTALHIEYGSGNRDFGDITTTGPVSGILWDVTGWGSSTPVFGFDLLLAGTTQPRVVTVPIDAATITGHASSAQLAAQSNDINSGIYCGVLSGIERWTISSAVITADYAYGPSTIDTPPPPMPVGPPNPSILQFRLMQFGSVTTHYDVGYINQLATTPAIQQQFNVPMVSSVPYMLVYAFYDLYPKSVPDEPVAIILTEPYEIRNRNQAGFRLVATPPGNYNPEAQWRYIVRAYGSQGAVAPVVLGISDQFWTPIPMTQFDETAVTGPTLQLSIDATSHAYGMPVNYGGTFLSLLSGGTTTAGGRPQAPWNYIRFLIHPMNPSAPIDFTGWTLSIVANAREL